MCKFISKFLFQADQTAASSPDQWGPDSFGTIQLDNKLINIITEIPEHKTLRSDRLKAIVSGDAITANRKNQTHVQLKPRSGHIIACNRFPRLGDNSGGMSRRLLMFRFNKRFTGATRRPEQALMDELHQAVPLIRLRCLYACADLMRKQEYTLSAEHERELLALQERSNAVAAFITQCVEIGVEQEGLFDSDDNSAVPQETLFKSYLLYCRGSNIIYTLSDREFYKELENSGLLRTPSGKAHRRFMNVSLKPQGAWGVFTAEELANLY